jgi:multimeric flavodoxin WrbA
VGAAQVAGTTTEYVSLAGKTISPCDGCIACLAAGHCVIDDDMQPLYSRLLASDAIILGTPVYFGSPSALCKAFMERVEGFGVKEKKLRLKVGGAIATAGSRNGGQENSMASIHLWFQINDMLPVGITSPVAQWGATGNTGFDSQDIHSDVFKLTPWPADTGSPARPRTTLMAKEIAYLYGRKIATVAAIVKIGVQQSGLDLPDKPYGFNLPDEFPPALYEIR